MFSLLLQRYCVDLMVMEFLWDIVFGNYVLSPLIGNRISIYHCYYVLKIICYLIL